MFDAVLFRKDIEPAETLMWQARQKGERPRASAWNQPKRPGTGIDLTARSHQTAQNSGLSQQGAGVHIQKFMMVLAAGILASVASAQADTRDDIIAAIQRCGVIHDNRVWLDCAYGAIQPMRAQLGLQPAPEFQQRLVPPPSSGRLCRASPARLSSHTPSASAAQESRLFRQSAERTAGRGFAYGVLSL